jgi:hypothetical protein
LVANRDEAFQELAVAQVASGAGRRDPAQMVYNLVQRSAVHRRDSRAGG